MDLSTDLNGITLCTALGRRFRPTDSKFYLLVNTILKEWEDWTFPTHQRYFKLMPYVFLSQLNFRKYWKTRNLPVPIGQDFPFCQIPISKWLNLVPLDVNKTPYLQHNISVLRKISMKESSSICAGSIHREPFL